MAHFAQLDDNNNVIQVIVISNDDLLDENGVEQEHLGIQVCQTILGAHTRWVQTSYNNNFRKKYAGIGDKYDLVADIFYPGVAPFPSWTLDSNFEWQPPAPYPNDGAAYMWDEEALSWVNLPITPESE